MIRFKLLILLITFSLPSVGQEGAKGILQKATNQLLTMNMELSVDVIETDTKGRIKEKSYEVLMAKFGEIEKTRMTMQKPDQAKGITVIITNLPDEMGIIEVYTPANGITRKIKATPANMARVGSNFQLPNYAPIDHKDLNYTLLGKQQIAGDSCYQLEVSKQSDSIDYKAEFWIEVSTFNLVQMVSFDEDGNQTRITTLSDFQPINGLKNKIQPMLIQVEDIDSNMHTWMQVLNISPQTDLTEEDFSILGDME